MRALILAAGYATRMYPLTADRPKPLLPVGQRPIIDHLVERICRVPEVERIVVVTNGRFAEHFLRWRDGARIPVPTTILDDGTASNEGRLGALGDLRLVLERLGTKGDWLVAAGDNLFEFDLRHVVDLSRAKGADAITCYEQPDLERLRRTGVAEVAEDGRVLDFEEKPREPRSRCAVPPLYVYTEATLEELPGYLAEGNPSDAPGHFVRWLCRRKPVFAWRSASGPIDVGTIESYLEADRIYSVR
jgi:glucose-1-phosphate thymidylyltransferase